MELHVVGGPPGAKLFAAGGELTDQIGQAAVVGVAASFDAQGGDAVAGDDLPLGVKVAGARVEEQVAGKVEAGGALGVDVGEQSPAEFVGSEDVHAVIADVGGCADAVEDAQHTLPHAGWAGGAAQPAGPGAAWRAALHLRGCVSGGGEVEQVCPSGLVELKSARQRVEDCVRGAGEVPPLQARVVVGAHAGEHGDLLSAQPPDAAPAAVERDPRLAGGEPAPAAGEEVADLVPVVHASTVRPGHAARARNTWRSPHPAATRRSGSAPSSCTPARPGDRPERLKLRVSGPRLAAAGGGSAWALNPGIEASK